MKRIVIGSRNRVLATDGTRFISGAALVANFAAYWPALEVADALVWAWYARDERGNPDIAATLRGTETVVNRLASFGLRGVFLSTDAVFSGREGGYGEDATPEPLCDYGRLKLAQEALMGDFVTLRFTTFGPSYSPARPLLLEMIANGSATIERPRQFFSPISTVTLNRTIDEVLAGTQTTRRVYHLTSERIGKPECCTRLAIAAGVPLPSYRTVDDAALDLSLTSQTHAFALDGEITSAVSELKRLSFFTAQAEETE